MKPNLENEKFFINLVRTGILSVSVSGQVYNNKTKRVAGYTTNRGYRALGHKDGKKVRHILIHRLVFLIHGKQDITGKQVNHLNGLRTKNALYNLEPATNQENNQHAWDMGFRKTTDRQRISASMIGISKHGERNGAAKLTDKQATYIRKCGKSIRRAILAKQFGVSVRTISDVIRGITYAPRAQVKRNLFFQRRRIFVIAEPRSVFRFSSNWRPNKALDTELNFN
jgi:hypothetical protein